MKVEKKDYNFFTKQNQAFNKRSLLVVMIVTWPTWFFAVGWSERFGFGGGSI